MLVSTYPRCGHPRVPSNTIMVRKGQTGKSYPACKQCKRCKNREWMQRKRGTFMRESKPKIRTSSPEYLAELKRALERAAARRAAVHEIVQAQLVRPHTFREMVGYIAPRRDAE